MSAVGRPLVGLAALLGLTAAAYAPGLGGPFVFDDFSSIVGNPYVRVERLDWEAMRDAARSGQAGALGRPLAMMSFALNAYGGELHPFPFKVTNLVIHLLNGLLVYALSFLLVRRLGSGGEALTPGAAGVYSGARWLPLVVTALWLLHPVQLTGVLYVVQRMTSLAATLVLAGLVGFLLARARFETRPVAGMLGMGAALGVGVVLGLGAKETAVLLVPLAVVVELTVLDRAHLPRARRRALGAFYGVLVGVPLLVVLGLTVHEPDWLLAGYVQRDFGPLERLLTEARVLFFYLGLIAYPSLTRFSLFHDDFPVSSGLLAPATTGLAVLAWIALVLLAVRGAKHHRVAVFALGWYLVGHALEGSIVPLELVFEHRNYLPLLGIAFALAWYGARGLERWVAAPALRATLPVLVVVGLAGITAARASVWSSSPSLAGFLAAHHPTSARALTASAFGSIAAGRPMATAYAEFQAAVARDENAVAPLVEMRKMLSGFAGVLRGHGIEGPAANGTPPLEPDTVSPGAGVATGAFPATLAEVVAVAARVEAELERRLRVHPVSIDAALSLRKLQECVRASIDVCRDLVGRARHWHALALANPRMEPGVRARVQLSAARLELFVGRPADAVALTRAAVRSDPGDIGFQVHLVELHAFLGEWEAGEQALAALEAQVEPGSFRAGEVRSARDRFTRARARDGRPASGS